MKSVLLQPSYIPWRGFFHQIYMSNLFIHYDDAQYDKHGWRNRNKIRNKNGELWLTIPVLSKGNVENNLLIKDVRINNSTNWAKKHWQTIEQSYSKTLFFDKYSSSLKSFFDNPPELLVDFVIPLTEHISSLLDITHVKFLRSSTLACSGNKTEKIVNILKYVESNYYISGPSAKDYMDENLLAENNITVRYMDYMYGDYPSLFGNTSSSLSIIDLLFIMGPLTNQFIWGSKPDNQKEILVA